MMKKIFAACMIIVLLNGCASSNFQSRLEEKAGENRIVQYSNAQTVEEIRKLRPQAHFPLSIAVIPPARWSGLSQQEREIIDGWGKNLKKIGFASSLQIVPRSLMPDCGYKSESDCYLTKSREAGARLGADAILFLSDTTATDSYVNPLSVLDLTIIGMWVIPAHHRDSYSIYEASLFDIDNGYLYATAEGYGEDKCIRPYVYADNDTGQDAARIKALNDVGGKLLLLAKEQMDKQSPSNNVPKVPAH